MGHPVMIEITIQSKVIYRHKLAKNYAPSKWLSDFLSVAYMWYEDERWGQNTPVLIDVASNAC